MAAQKSFLFDRLMPVTYSVGAAVVILGALFKILHWKGAEQMLMVGMMVEAAIFLLFALQTWVQSGHQTEYDWTKVYPELSDNYRGPVRQSQPIIQQVAQPQTMGLTSKMDEMLSNARISPEVFESLGRNMRSLSDNVAQMSDLSAATVATKDYASNARAAGQAMAEMAQSYGMTSNAFTSMSNAANDVKRYHQQANEISQKLSNLSSIYDEEIRTTSDRVRSTNSYLGQVAQTMQSVGEATKDSAAFRNELARLNSNLASINNVYSNMLAAMKGGR